jgi:FtsP/CotA-like multicopper oxidase with cupredoxin domain
MNQLNHHSHHVRKLSRRDFLRVGGGLLAAAAGTRLLPKRMLAQSTEVALAASPSRGMGLTALAPLDITPNIHLVGTDGWISLPGQVPIPGTTGQYYNPDALAPEGLSSYIFGFANVTGLTDEQAQARKMKAQATAPMFWVNENQEYYLKLGNLGLQMRPDLTDSHTLHWHGFRNAWPVFDGEPHSSLAVPVGRSLMFYYRPLDPGTYMYHCHFEETEHVHMGMTGAVFVRPAQDQAPLNPGERYVYNDGDGTTAFDREFVIVLTDFWAEAHWDDAHIQLPDWTDFKPDFYLMNGRVYPDTIAPKGAGTDPLTGDLIPTPGYEHLQYQPISSLIQANAGDRVLLRFINLSFGMQSMTLPGLKMKIVGKDATLLRGRDGTDLSYMTNTVFTGAGQSVDAIFTAPGVPSGVKKYLLYNRNYDRLSNAGGPGYGGQMTEIHIHPAGTLPPQTEPNI